MGLLQRSDLRASSLQMAADRRWEAAIEPLRMSACDLEDWLAQTTGDVAIECVFRDASGRIAGHIGLRRTIPGPAERSAFWRDVAGWADGLMGLGPAPVAERLLAGFGLPGLFATPPAETEIGVFNQWLSAVPVKLMQGQLRREDLATGPEWLRSGATAPICREEAWHAPERVWLAEVISEERDGRHYLPDAFGQGAVAPHPLSPSEAKPH